MTKPAPCIIAVSPDATLGQQLATALDGLGAVAVHPALDAELRADLLVLATTEVVTRWTGPIIVVASRSSLAGMVDLMRASVHVVCVIAAEDFDADGMHLAEHVAAVVGATGTSDDPRGQKIAMKVISLQCTEPDPALFQIPPDYKVVEQPN